MNRLLLASMLMVASLIWGWTFVVVKDAVAVYPIVAFLAIRFSIGGVLLGVFNYRRLTRKTLWTGAGIGVPLALGYLSQTIGLHITTATNCGLITGLFVLMTPLVNRLLFGVKVRLVTWAMLVVSLAGMCLLTGSGPDPLNAGDLLTLGAAVMYGLHISLLDRYAKEHDPLALAFLQIASASIIFWLILPIEGVISWPDSSVWTALLITGVLATALAFMLQIYVQQRLSAVATVLILALEPVFAAVFGWILRGERLNGVQFLGVAMMIGAVVAFQCMSYARSRSSNNNRDTNIATVQ